jgi:hypothetical protein
LPDVSVLLAAPATKYLLDPAHIAIEILSEDDKMTRFSKSLPNITRKAFRTSGSSIPG